MSSFNSVPFKVIPDGNFFPQFEKDSEGAKVLDVDILIESKARLSSLVDLLTLETHKRPHGTMGLVVHVEAGNISPKSLSYPDRGGALRTLNAYLIKLSGIKVYGRPTGGGTLNQQYQASATFLATGDPD